ncbi:hypothetical protein RJT34_23538 [Clitoria ternatea]|uniref:Uncharacterized protein n=1 Tax=Clitoria ternatea TaxID=43366 RepID=A0AAN9FUW0_CLITE
MGCFMACFGLSNKRKRRKTLYKVLGAHQKYGNYEVLAISEKSIIPCSNIRGRDEGKEQKSVERKKKKVTFNLNIQVYEPNPIAYQVLNDEAEEQEGMKLASSNLPKSYPTNHRYHNCRDDGFDEEDEIAYEESDIDDCDYDDDEFDWDDGGSDESLENDEAEVYDESAEQKELPESCYPSVAEGRIKNQKLLAPNDAGVKSNLSGRDMHSVLSPVENLTQWKAIKAKVSSSKYRRKENVPSEASLNFSPCSIESNALQSKPLLPEVAVDASLSNWLISPNYNVSKTTIHCQ